MHTLQDFKRCLHTPPRHASSALLLYRHRYYCLCLAGLLVIVFFLSYIMLVSFIVLNLFVGVVTSSLNQATKEVTSVCVRFPSAPVPQLHLRLLQVRSDPDTLTGEDEYEEPTNTQIETLVTSLQGELQDCRQEMGDIRDKLAMILQDQNQ
jgi:hypothetical protein